MKRPMTFKALGSQPRQKASDDEFDASISADERVPIDLNAVRWVVVGVFLFWLIMFCIGLYFVG